jgi:O-antigen ligase
MYLSKNKVRGLLFLLLLSVMAVQFVPDSYLERVGTITDAEDTSRTSRLRTWQLGWQIFLDHPILGVGPRNYPWHTLEYQVALPDYEPGEQILSGRAAHSLYFQMLPEYGLVGTGLFAALLLALMRRLNRCEEATLELLRQGSGDAETNLLVARAIKASIIAYLTTGAFISVLHYPHFWYTLGFVVALSRDVIVRPRLPARETSWRRLSL